MKSKRILMMAGIVLAALALFATVACKSGGMAVTRRGQFLKINIAHPIDLPESGEDNLDVVLGNRGVKDVKDVIIDVELPPQLIVLDETHDRGMTMSQNPGSNVYHYTAGNIQPAEDSHIRYKVRTSFGNLSETGSVRVTAWQRDLVGDKLVETAVIRLRR